MNTIIKLEDIDFSKSVNLLGAKRAEITVDDMRKNLLANKKTEVRHSEKTNVVVMRFKYANEYIKRNDDTKSNQFVIAENVSKSDYEANKEMYERLLKESIDDGMWDDECKAISKKMSDARQ